MKREIEIQQENIKELIRLTQENPNLKIVPMVDTDVCCSDAYSCWTGGWGKPRIDECRSDDERIYFKYNDFEDLVQDYIDNTLSYDSEMKYKSDEELEKIAEKYVNNLPWEKVITVHIGTP